MVKTISAYLCSYCAREYRVLKNCLTHERKCYKNPAMRACASCKHFEHGFTEKHYLIGGDDHEKSVHEMACLIDKMPYWQGISGPTTDCQYWEEKER